MDLKTIKKAIISNLAVKNPHTLEVDHVIEGNSYFGMCIFIGVGLMYGNKEEEIELILNIGPEEREFYHKKFLLFLNEYYNETESTTTKRFGTKVNLILNYIKNHGGKQISLAEIIKDNIE